MIPEWLHKWRGIACSTQANRVTGLIVEIIPCQTQGILSNFKGQGKHRAFCVL